VLAAAVVQLIERSLAGGGHVPDFRPDVIALVCAAIAHEAHHRGQICHWARELGAPLGPEEQLQLWDWHGLWKQTRTDGTARRGSRRFRTRASAPSLPSVRTGAPAKRRPRAARSLE
jgi:DinB family protein